MEQVTPESGSTRESATPSFTSANASQPSQPTKVESAKPGSEAESPPAAPDPGDKSKPSEDGRDIRIKELTRRLRQSERNYERAMRMAETRPTTAPQPQPQAQPAARKTLKDFNYDEAAYDAYKEAEIAARHKSPSADDLAKQVREQMAAQERRSKFDQRAQKFAETSEDYDEVVAGQWLCSQPMAEAIEESEEGPAIAYYLAQNPEISAQLSKLGAVQAGREIDRIERKLVEERKKAAEKPVSQAPPPPPKIEGGDPGNVERDPSKMTDAQFRKWRENAMGRRR